MEKSIINLFFKAKYFQFLKKTYNPITLQFKLITMSFLNNLEWRYATQQFDTNRRVSDEDIHTIVEAIRLAPASYGLQGIECLSLRIRHFARRFRRYHGIKKKSLMLPIFWYWSLVVTSTQ